MYINEMNVSDSVDGNYILQNAFAKTASNGKPFLSVVLEDKTGTIEGKVWDYAGPVSPADIGAVVRVKGSVSEFRGMPQLTVDRIRLCDESDRVNLSELVPTAPIDAPGAQQEIQALIDSMDDRDYAALCTALMEKFAGRFENLPAAKSVHHGFVHGLLMHTLFMLRTADYLAGLYPEVIDRSLLLAGTLLHDISKCDEFVTSPLGLATGYSVSGELIGHLVMGAQEVAQCARELGTPEDKAVLLQHMILSHHGEPEYGAAVRPVCAESELLSYIDMIDSRMEIYRETLAEVPCGEFSKRIFALDNKRIYRHF